jgi:hypothetical protein
MSLVKVEAHFKEGKALGSEEGWISLLVDSKLGTCGAGKQDEG